MTEMVFAVIDNHKKKKGHGYNIIFHSRDPTKFQEYLKEKGLVN